MLAVKNSFQSRDGNVFLKQTVRIVAIKGKTGGNSGHRGDFNSALSLAGRQIIAA